ncbi:MAG: hypothetical protein JRJ87_28055 [Deltaproteobacteria bacterium]|nr:hypothetical protein [Deltaproteobacteria bacterium]
MKYRLQVLIPKVLDARIRKAAKRQSISKGAWVCLAIEQALKREQLDLDPLEKLDKLQAPTADIDEMLIEIEGGRRS